MLQLFFAICEWFLLAHREIQGVSISEPLGPLLSLGSILSSVNLYVSSIALMLCTWVNETFSVFIISDTTNCRGRCLLYTQITRLKYSSSNKTNAPIQCTGFHYEIFPKSYISNYQSIMTESKNGFSLCNHKYSKYSIMLIFLHHLWLFTMFIYEVATWFVIIKKKICFRKFMVFQLPSDRIWVRCR